jgi:hypothetical protein
MGTLNQAFALCNALASYALDRSCVSHFEVIADLGVNAG